MPDLRNPAIQLVAGTAIVPPQLPGQWMPSCNASGTPISGGELVTVLWLLWGGDSNAWTTTVVQTNTLSSQMLRALGPVVASVAAGSAGSTVNPVGTGDPEVVVGTATVNSRANVTLQWRNATTHVNINSVVNLDVLNGYAGVVASCFTGFTTFGL